MAAVDHASADEQRALVRRLPELDGVFPATRTLLLHPARHSGVHAEMQALLQGEALDDRVQRNLLIALEQSAPHAQ
ncbi:MAG: hypothetical protein ACRDS1_15815 [Pseudonocardiaceae bacterium]